MSMQRREIADVVRRGYDAKVDDADDKTRTVVSVISTDGPDSYRSVFLPQGAELERYRKNPVVLLQHGGGPFGGDVEAALPIGRNLWIKRSGNKLLAKTQFTDEETNPLGAKVYRLLAGEFMRGFSIGARPLEESPPTRAELKEREDWAAARVSVVYRRWELVEYSVVDVPSNPDAVVQAITRGIALPGWESPPPAPPEPNLPPLVGVTFRQAHAALVREIRAALPDVNQLINDRLDIARGRI